jgi:hypothetical protein
MSCRISTFAALLLDIHTLRKTTRRGVYVKPEDEKDAHKLNYLKTTLVQNTGYDVSSDHRTVTTGSGEAWHEQDIGYHSRYGAELETQEPLGPHGRRSFPSQEYQSQVMLEQQAKDRLLMAHKE